MSMTRCACLLALSLSSCGEELVVSKPVITLDLSQEKSADGEEVVRIDLVQRAWSEGFQYTPIGTTPRPVEVVAVLDADEVLLRSDRGEEHVRVQGLSGYDDRLPKEVGDLLRGDLAGHLEGWLTRSGAEVFESTLYGARGASNGPSFLDADGLRLVTLSRRHGGSGHVLRDVREYAIANGLALQAHPYSDPLALDVNWALASEPDSFLPDHPVVRGMRESYATEVQVVLALEQPELQVIGEELHADVAEYLGWEPAVELEFTWIDEEASRPVLRGHLEREKEAQDAWLQELVARMQAELQGLQQPSASRSGEVGSVEGDDLDASRFETTIHHTGPTIDERVTSMIEELHAYSPAGPTVYVLRKPELTRSMLEEVLVHEIMHQYQEELIQGLSHFPAPMTPIELGEAHAEYLSTEYRAERREGFRRWLGIDSQDATRYFAALVEASGLTADEIYLKYVNEEWEREPWDKLMTAEHGFQEFCFEVLETESHGGLEFHPVDGTGLREGDGPVVRISNVTDRPFRGQFHGEWIWTLEGELEGSVTLDGPPFNLLLPAGESVEIRISHQPKWAELPPGRITGLFGRTP